MKKKKLGANTYLYPMPTTIVGANVDNKANFIAISYCGIAQHFPPMIAITLGRRHYTNAGIKENNTFSVNIPSEDMVVIVDYLGIKSGKEIDKSKLFEIFYGDLKTAPMIKKTPLNLECELVKVIDFGKSHEIFIGEIITNGLPDIKKLKPIVFSMHDANYWKVGEHLGKAWSIGRNYKEGLETEEEEE